MALPILAKTHHNEARGESRPLVVEGETPASLKKAVGVASQLHHWGVVKSGAWHRIHLICLRASIH